MMFPTSTRVVKKVNLKNGPRRISKRFRLERYLHLATKVLHTRSSSRGTLKRKITKRMISLKNRACQKRRNPPKLLKIMRKRSQSRREAVKKAPRSSPSRPRSQNRFHHKTSQILQASYRLMIILKIRGIKATKRGNRLREPQSHPKLILINGRVTLNSKPSKMRSFEIGFAYQESGWFLWWFTTFVDCSLWSYQDGKILIRLST